MVVVLTVESADANLPMLEISCCFDGSRGMDRSVLVRTDLTRASVRRDRRRQERDSSRKERYSKWPASSQ
jgi:hypothetical protein